MEKRLDNKKYLLAPVCLFTYNRLLETKQTVEALQNNFLASQSELFVFSDGWKNADDREKVIAVRDFLKNIKGFKKVVIVESELNKGLANSIIDGVTRIITEYNRVIVVEDDLRTATNFLNFMNQCLDSYVYEESVFSVSGHSLKFTLPVGYDGDVYLFGRTSSWGWATWKNRWDLIDWEIKDWNNFNKDAEQKMKFNKNGSDMYSMLRDYMLEKNNSWAIRFCYAQFRLNRSSIFPIISKIDNIGFGINSTNCNVYNRFAIDFDISDKIWFDFPKELVYNQLIIDQIVDYFSVKTRIKSKFITWYYKLINLV